MRDFEGEARDKKVAAIVSVLQDRYRFLPLSASREHWTRDDSQEGTGARGPRMSITEWVSQDAFPWRVFEKAAGIKPCSDTTRAQIVAELEAA